AVQRLQFFLSESTWDPEAINTRRLALLLSDPATVPHAEGVLVIDDTGDRKAGTHTDHVARQWLGSIGKVDNGSVTVSSLWADERVYYPLHVRPYTPAPRLPLGKKDAADLTFSGYGPERLVRLVVATTDPATLPAISTWYLTTNLPRPASHRAADSPHAPADLAEIVRLYGLRNRVVVGFGLGTALSAFA